jgi:hypothetical protein
MYYIICYLILALFVLDPVEPKFEELQEPAPVEDANPSRIKASLDVSNHFSWVLFIFLYYL